MLLMFSNYHSFFTTVGIPGEMEKWPAAPYRILSRKVFLSTPLPSPLLPPRTLPFPCASSWFYYPSPISSLQPPSVTDPDFFWVGVYRDPDHKMTQNNLANEPSLNLVWYLVKIL